MKRVAWHPTVLPGRLARWRSGYAAACKAVYTGSIPVRASSPYLFDLPRQRRNQPTSRRRRQRRTVGRS